MRQIIDDGLIQKNPGRTFFTDWDSLKKEFVFYEINESIYELEAPVNCLYLLVEGTVRVTAPNAGGNDTHITTLCGGTLFGEIEYLLDCPAVSAISALSDVYCIRIPIAANRELLKNDCRFYRHISHMLAERMTLANNIAIQKARLPLANRLARYLLEHYDSSDDISDLKPMCDILHCSYRQLLRVLKKLCLTGFLVKDERRGIYHLSNTDAL